MSYLLLLFLSRYEESMFVRKMLTKKEKVNVHYSLCNYRSGLYMMATGQNPSWQCYFGLFDAK